MREPSTIESAIAVFPDNDQAESAVKELQQSGFDMTKLSIIGKDYYSDEHVTGYYTLGDRMKKWGSFGAFWGGMWGLLFGAAFFWVPGVGQVLIGGPFILMIIAALEDAVVVGGLSALGAALIHMGVPKDSALKYETQIKANKFVLIAHGTSDEVARARTLLTRNSAGEAIVHSTTVAA